MPCVSGECNIISRISVDFFLLDFSPLGDEEGRIRCVLFLNIAFIFSLDSQLVLLQKYASTGENILFLSSSTLWTF